jgi:hypothetical protein
VSDEPIKVLWEELKPCPFCGRPAALDLEGEVHLVVCQWCWARVSSHTEEDAVHRWNTRPVEVLHILGHKAARDELLQVRDELKQARADALLLAVLWNGTNRNRAWFHLADNAVVMLDDAERSTLAELWYDMDVTSTDVVRLLRRALGEQHET